MSVRCATAFAFVALLPLLRAEEAPLGPTDGADRVNWDSLFRQSMFFLGIQHGFRLATEPGTREGLKGPFLNGWYDSLSNLHGWADGDPFYVNYVGHPMQGAVAGYLWVHNDGKYRKAEFGNNAFYWKSRLRATAYSWAYSTQFEIGPLSEASIGKVQSLYPQQGFVDHVATPTIGTAWMLAEDALDRFVIKKFENRFENFYARMMVRSWLNPGRSFANMLRWKEPWYRDTRLGIGKYRDGMGPYLAPKDSLSKPVSEEPWSMPANFEFTLSPQFVLSPGGEDALRCAGGVGTAQWNITTRRSWLAEGGGCKMIGLKENFSGDMLTYMFGQRWTARGGSGREGRWMPYAQALIGGKRITIDEVFPEKKAELEKRNGGQPLGYEYHEQWTKTHQANGFAFSVGGGVDYGLTRAATLRLASVDYSHAWLPRPELASYPDSLKFTMGITLRVGSW